MINDWNPKIILLEKHEALMQEKDAEIERLRALIQATHAGAKGAMYDLWTAVREPEKSAISIDHALNHLAQALRPLRREALGE